MPILFIVAGTKNGFIAKNEVQTYPSGHYYAVQENAWMDSGVWQFYLECISTNIDGPCLLLVDNLKCHVNEQSYQFVGDVMGSILEPLPKNSTSVCQPLDVGVMGPFKKKLVRAWMEEESLCKTASEKRLAIICRAIKIWDDLDEDLIRKSFLNAIPPTGVGNAQPASS